MQIRSIRTGSLLGIFLGMAIAALITTVTPAAAGGKVGNGVKCTSDSDCESGDCSGATHVCRGRDN
jgi:hypothetical protein